MFCFGCSGVSDFTFRLRGRSTQKVDTEFSARNTFGIIFLFLRFVSNNLQRYLKTQNLCWLSRFLFDRRKGTESYYLLLSHAFCSDFFTNVRIVRQTMREKWVKKIYEHKYVRRMNYNLEHRQPAIETAAKSFRYFRRIFFAHCLRFLLFSFFFSSFDSVGWLCPFLPLAAI